MPEEKPKQQAPKPASPELAEAKARQLQAVASFPPTMPVYIPAGHLRRLGMDVDQAVSDQVPFRITVGELRKSLA